MLVPAVLPPAIRRSYARNGPSACTNVPGRSPGRSRRRSARGRGRWRATTGVSGHVRCTAWGRPEALLTGLRHGGSVLVGVSGQLRPARAGRRRSPAPPLRHRLVTDPSPLRPTRSTRLPPRVRPTTSWSAGSGRCAARSTCPAPKLGAQADGGDDPGRRRLRAVERARDRRRHDHGRAVGGDRGRRRHPRARRLTMTNRGDLDTRGARTSWWSGFGRRSTCSVRCSPGAGTCGSRCRAATTSAPARSTCTSPGWRRWGPSSGSATARWRRARLGSGRRRCLRVPERRRHREPGDRRRLGRRGDRRSTTRPVSPRSSTCASSSFRWAPASAVSARPVVEIEGVGPGGSTPWRTRPSPTASRPRPTWPRWRWPAASCTSPTPGPTHAEPARQVRRDGAGARRTSGRSHGPSGRAAAFDRRPDPAVPGDRDRLQAAGHHHAERRRRRRHRHREPVPGSLPLRRGAVAAGADIRTNGHHAVVRGVPGCRGHPFGRTTSGRARRWSSPVWRPRARR